MRSISHAASARPVGALGLARKTVFPMKVFHKRNNRAFYAVERRKNRVKPIGNVRVGAAVLPKGHKRKIQNIIRTVCDKHVFRRNAVKIRDRLFQRLCLWIRIKAKGPGRGRG